MAQACWSRQRATAMVLAAFTVALRGSALPAAASTRTHSTAASTPSHCETRVALSGSMPRCGLSLRRVASAREMIAKDEEQLAELTPLLGSEAREDLVFGIALCLRGAV